MNIIITMFLMLANCTVRARALLWTRLTDTTGALERHRGQGARWISSEQYNKLFDPFARQWRKDLHHTIIYA